MLLGSGLAWGERGVPGTIPPNVTSAKLSSINFHPYQASVAISVTVEEVKRDLVFNFLDQISSGTFRRG